MATSATVIVCEQRGKWAAALRRHLSPTVRLRETRALAECAVELDSAPASFLVLELRESNLPRLLTFLAESSRLRPRAAMLVVAEPHLAEHEWPVREAGAVHFDVSTRAAAAWATLAEKHFERTPDESSPLAELVGGPLPWEEI